MLILQTYSNLFNFLLVCNAGYFQDGNSCSLCTGNTIKTRVGNVTNCDADEPCDGVETVPNEDHTACGRSSSLLIVSL